MKPVPRSRPLPRGFTLLELVIALAVSSLVALMATAGLSFGLDFSKRMHHRLDEQMQAAQAERMLRQHWSQRSGQAEVEERTLRFTTTVPLMVQGAPVSGAVVYECRAEDDTTASPWALVQSVIPVADGRSRDPVEPLVLLDNLSECRFSFLRLRPPQRPVGGASTAQAPPTPEWVSKWPLGEAAPQVVRAHWSGARGTMPERVFAAVRR
jgi:prepilin-type N-terminal cleavage/methylation domain-containing protein